MTFEIDPFEPRFPWQGGVLQTFATSLMRAPEPFGDGETEYREFKLADGTGDRMIGMLDRQATPKEGLPLVVLLHGMPGDADSRYMIRTSRYLLGLGYRVLRLNLRGAGPSLETCRRQYSAAASEDLREFFAVVPDDLKKDGLAAVGFSVGGAILLKYLGELEQRGAASPLKAACTVSAPLDLLGTCRQVMSPIYHRILFPTMKRTTLRAKLSDLERANVEASTTIFELDDRYGGPHRLVRGGTDDYFRGAAGTFKGIDDHFKGAADYYAASSAAGYLDEIRVPTLVVAALDDPWVPGGTYLTHLWRRNTHLTPLVADHGGHVGFHGKADKQPWSDIAVARFLQSEWDAA